MTNTLLIFKADKGQAAIAIEDVCGIYPNNEHSCWVYATIFPEGVLANVSSTRLIGEWSEILEENKEEMVEAIREIPLYHPYPESETSEEEAS